MGDVAPRTMAEYIAAIRGGLVCDRCQRYVGSLAAERYAPAPYPIALEDAPPEDEAQTLIAFEWHLLGMLRRGRFVIRHPERDGACVSVEEWARDDDGDDGHEEKDAAADAPA